MASSNLLAGAGLLVALTAAGAARAQTPERYFIRGGPAYAVFDGSARVSVAGQRAPGNSATIKHNEGVAIEGGVRLSPDWSVSLTVGVPPTAKLYGAGAFDKVGHLGSANYGPSALIVQRYLPKVGKLEPYVGAGVSYTIILDSKDAAIQGLQINNGVGPTIQVGAEYPIARRLALFVDAKKIWVKVDATGAAPSPIGPQRVEARVTLNPVIFNTGLSYHF
ncbi:MAG: OmpW family protein [Caulobacter sp.]|nr:OmpW family protein [Caulobacter sp.]